MRRLIKRKPRIECLQCWYRGLVEEGDYLLNHCAKPLLQIDKKYCSEATPAVIGTCGQCFWFREDTRDTKFKEHWCGYDPVSTNDSVTGLDMPGCHVWWPATDKIMAELMEECDE